MFFKPSLASPFRALATALSISSTHTSPVIYMCIHLPFLLTFTPIKLHGGFIYTVKKKPCKVIWSSDWQQCETTQQQIPQHMGLNATTRSIFFLYQSDFSLQTNKNKETGRFRGRKLDVLGGCSVSSSCLDQLHINCLYPIPSASLVNNLRTTKGPLLSSSQELKCYPPHESFRWFILSSNSISISNFLSGLSH